MPDLDDVTVVTGPPAEQLNERQLLDDRSQREACLEWLLPFGKDPDQVEGYAVETVRARAGRMDMFYRWVWDREDRYVAAVTHDHGDASLQHQAYRDTSNADKAGR